MFANCQMMGLDLAFPDVCKTPPALPIPYPNFALGPTAIPNAGTSCTAARRRTTWPPSRPSPTATTRAC